MMDRTIQEDQEHYYTICWIAIGFVSPSNTWSKKLTLDQRKLVHSVAISLLISMRLVSCWCEDQFGYVLRRGLDELEHPPT
jgi:hypothetical protein